MWQVGCCDRTACIAGLVRYICARARQPVISTLERSSAPELKHADDTLVSGDVSNEREQPTESSIDVRTRAGERAQTEATHTTTYPTLVIESFEQSLQRWPAGGDAGDEFLQSQTSSQDRVKLRRVRKDKLLDAFQGKCGASLKEACRLADIAGVDSGLINQAWAKARDIMFEEELKHAIEDGDLARIERACKLAVDVEVDEKLVAKGEAEARRLNAKKKASNARSSGDVARIERACRQAELAGVDNAFLAPIIAEGLRLRAQRKQQDVSEPVCESLATYRTTPSKQGRRVSQGHGTRSAGLLQASHQNTSRPPLQRASSNPTKRRVSDLLGMPQHPQLGMHRELRRPASVVKARHASSTHEADNTSQSVTIVCEPALLSLVERGLLCTQAKPRGQDQDDIASVASQFSVALPGTRVISVMRIENSNLTTRYDAVWSTTADSTERELWHGTSEESAHNIILSGFNRAYCGKHGARYGNGTYFSTDAAYSTRFCDMKSGRGLMFLAKVLVGQWVEGKVGWKEPPYKAINDLARYDSTVDNADHPTIFCIFHDFQAIPLYLIEFERT